MSAKSTAPSCSTRRVNAAVIGALLVIGAASAAAQPEGKQPEGKQLDLAVATPEAWELDAELAVALQRNFREIVSLDEHGEAAGAAAYISAGNGALYIAWIKTTKPTDKAAEALRAVLDQLRTEPRSAALDPDAIEELEYSERVNKKAIEAAMAWRHKDNETLTISRTLAWQNKDKLLRVVRAECVFAESDKKRITDICKGALVSLASAEVEEDRVLDIVGFVKPTAPPADTAEDIEPSTGPSLNPAARTTPMVVTNDSKKKPRDRKSLWIFVIGAALIAFAFYSILQSKREADEGAKASDKEGGSREEEE